MKKFNFIKIVFLFSLLIVKGSIEAQNSLSLEDVLAISIKENIDIKIKTNELNQVKNYEKVGVLGTIPKIKVIKSLYINLDELLFLAYSRVLLNLINLRLLERYQGDELCQYS